MADNTLEYYKRNAEGLIKVYDDTKVGQLHELFEKYIRKDDVVLDIGFGSGRDMRNIMEITSNVYGLDSCDKFIENMSDTELKDRVGKTVLPKIDIHRFKVDKFNTIVSIAVIMHLSLKEIEQSIASMRSILMDNSIVIVSYSLERKIKDGRHFEPISEEVMLKLFQKNGFEKIDGFENSDGMNRDIQWITQVFRLGGNNGI